MKLSEYLKQNGMTTKDYFEMRKRKEEGKTSLSDYQRQLYQEIKSTDLSDIVKDLSSNKFLNQETLSSYNDRVSQVADKVSRFQMGDEESNKSFLENLKTLQSGISKASEYYSTFKDENDYKSQLKSIEQNKEWASADTKALKTEIEGLEKNYNSYIGIKTKRDDLYSTIVSGYMRAGYTKEKAEKAALSDGRIAKYDKELSQYGDMSNSSKTLSDKKQFYNNAKRIQEGIALQENAKNAEDFDKYSKSGADIENPTYDEVTGTILGPLGVKKIKNKVTYSRDNFEEYQDTTSKKRMYIQNENGSKVINGINELYTQMTDEEVAIYNYYLSKEGEEKANQFLDSITESLNYRQAEIEFEDNFRNNAILEGILGLSAGLDQWASGVESLFNTDGEYVPQSVTQIMGGMAREDLGEDYGIVGQGGYDLLNTTGNMLPSILVSTMTGNIAGGLGAGVKAAQTIGKIAGAATLGSSAAGNGYQEMLNLGYDKGQAQAYGTLVGISEAGLEYVLGGISSLGGKLSGGITDSIVTKLISNVDDAIAKVAIGAGGKLVGSMISEFGEEYLQEVLDPVFKNMALKTDEDIKLFSTEALYSGILGALSAGLLEGGSTISGEVATYKAGKDVKNSGQLSNLKKFGTSFSADTVAYKIASQVNENTDAYTIGQLLHEVGADSLSEANMAEITKSLERKGIESGQAQTIAKWLNKAVEGGYFTPLQRKALENPDISKTFKDVIINQNSTVNQRMQSYTDILQSIANEKETQKANKTKAKADKKANNKSQTAEESKVTPFVPYSSEEIARRQAEGEVVIDSEGKPITNTKNSVESKFEVNLEGKTVNVKSGEDVKVTEIASIDNGKMTLKLDNGETVDAEDISFGTEDEAIIYSSVLDMGVNAAIANSLVKYYNPSDKLSAKNYVLGIKEAYKYGAYGMPINEISKNGFAADLSEPQRVHAYNLGKTDMAAKVEKAQKEVEKVTSGKGGFEGKVHFNGDTLALKEVQRESLKRMGVLSEVLGVDIHVFESYVENGKRVYKDTDGKVKSAPNGYYKGGKIYIDLNAGRNGQGVMIYTVAHELTHFIREWSPAKFKVLADFLMEQYGEKGHNVNDLVQAQIDKAKRNNRTIDFDTAYEEVVADSMEMMLSDDAVYEKILELKSKDASIVKKIGEFFAKIVDSFKKLMQQYPPETPEGKLVSQMNDSFTKLQDLFAEALVDASNNYQANKEQKNTTSEGDVKFMARDEGDTSVKEQIKANQDLLNSMDTVASTQEFKIFANKQNALEWVLKRLENTGYKVNRKSFGEIIIDKKRLKNGLSYLKTNEEILAFAVLPQVLAKGVEIDSHIQHKGRAYNTFTFAAPVVVNGQRGNMAAVVRQEGKNYYKVHRLLMPDGSQLILNNKRDIAETVGGVNNNSGLSPTDNISKGSIPQTSKKSQEKLSGRDSLGNALTEAQQSYFAESKVRDENGNLKVMYHGTPNATFTKFRSGTYFTEHKWYADRYQNQSASSLSYKKTADNPDTYAVYLNIKKPFDTRNPEEARIFNEEYFGHWGMGTPLMESGLPDWLDGRDLQEFLEEQGYDYDGIILDEGSVGGYGDEVINRGISYVVFSPEQVKSVENKTPTNDTDYRFSMRENVEETKDLIAVHNLSEEKLLKSLELGGLPMPSIAIIRAREGHADFGKISLVFNKETIDPQFISKNKVFSGDAWTPTYPHIEHKVNDKAQKKVANRINNLVPEEVLRGLGGLHVDSYNLEQDLNRHNGNLVEMFRYNTALKYAFLTENGVQLELPNKFKPLGRYSNYDNDAIIRIAETVSEEKLRGIVNGYTNEQIYEVEPEIRKAINDYKQDKYKKLPEKAFAKLISEDTMSIGQVYDLAIDSLNYLTDGIKQEVDYYAARDLIDETIDAQKYEAWIKELFANIVEKEGIRNNKDMFTPSGNRRSFEALHYEHNLENVIKAMKEEGTKGIGTFGRGNIFGASTTEFETISDIKDAANTRMKNIPQEEYEATKKGFSERFFELAYSLPIYKDSFTATDSAANMLIEAVSKFKTKSGMANYLRSESKGWANYSDYVVDDLIELVNDIRNMPVGYFEAKPQRAVEFNEVATAIIPDNSSDELKAKLTDNSIKFVEYENGNEESRLEALNSLEDVKFSDRDTYAPTFYSKMGKTIDEMKQDKIGANSVVSYLKGRGVKDEEIKWSGIETFLEGKKSVTKAKLQEFVAGSMLQIEENIYNGPAIEVISEDGDNYIVRNKETREILDEWEWQEDVEDGMEGYISKNGNIALSVDEIEENAIQDWNTTRWSEMKLRGGTNYRELTFKMPNTYYSNYAMRTHWGEEAYGILAHARIQDFETDNGKMLFIEEIQSDWHNEGHKYGYSKKLSPTERKRVAELYEMQDSLIEQMRVKHQNGDFDGAAKLHEQERKLYLEGQKITGNKDGTPDAPFKDNYHEYVLKRLLRMAAEQGYDSIGWTPANLQSQRWSDEYAEGYRIEYDQDIPKFLNKYGKKWGAKVGTTTLNSGAEVWSMPITDSMKESVLYEGQVMYSDRDSKTAEDIKKINKQLARENVKLIEDVKYLKELVKLQSKETHGKMLKKSTVELVAKRLMAYANAKGDISELVGHLSDVYSYIIQGEDVSWETIKEKSQAAVDWLMSNEYYKPVRNEEANEILKHLRNTRVSLSESQKKEVAYRYESYNEYRKRNMGRIIFTNDGVKLDSVWQELAELFPGHFDTEISEGDQPLVLMEIIDGLQNAYEVDDHHYYSDEMIAQDLLTKIYDGYWDVSALHTVADAKQKEINLLKAKHKERMDELRQSHEESDAKLRQEHRERVSQLRTQYREREEAKVRKVAEYYQKSRKDAVERVKETREKREAVTKLQRIVLDTAKWVSYPKKDDVKCPDIIRGPYAEFLSSIDLSSKRLLSGGEPTQNDLRVSSAMDSLAKAIEKKLGTQSPDTETETVLDTGYLDLPVHFVENLKEMAESLKKRMAIDGHVVNSMTSDEVKALTKFIRTLNHSIKEMSTLYSNMRFARVEQLGNDSMLFLKDLGEAKQTNSITNFVTWDNALPYYTFKRFGVAGESVFEELMDAQDRLAYLADGIFKFKDKTWTDKEASEWSKDTHTIKLPSGRELTLTSADAMSIYCLSRREQGLQHLLGGGVRVLGIEEKGKKANDSRSLLNQQDILAIASSLTERQKKVAEAIQEYMSTTCAEWGNEISMKRFLTKEFTEKFYFPIESNDENLDTKDPKAQQSDLYRLLNISATKPLTKGANNEVIIRNVFDVFTNHSSDMAKLNAYGMALLDYMKWINYREKTVNDDGQISVSGVRKSMERAYGPEAKKYVIGLIKDINGRANDGGDHPFLMKMTRMAKTAMVGANLRVSLLQFTAYPRAAMVLSNKSLALGLTKAPQIEKAKKYCGIALWKSFGFYDTNISRSIEDQIKGTTNLKQKLIELSLKGAEWGDAITWGCLWNACEYEVAKTQKYKVGSEEFNQAVGKKLREVVYVTQVVDSTLTRSQMMRNKSGLTQSASAFMSEPTLSANILMDAGFQFNLEKRRTGSAKLAWQKTGKYIGKAVAVYSIGQIIAALAEALADAYRDDDDEEFITKFGEAFTENVISDLNPFNKIPIIADVSDLILSWFGIGFSSSNSLYLQSIDEAKNAFDTWSKVINGEDGKTVYAGIYSTTKLLSYITGVSASGAMREVVTLWNNTAGAADPYLKIRTYESSATDKGIAEYKFDKGDAASVKTTVSKMIEDKMKSGKTEKEAKSAVRSSFTSSYKSEYIAAVKSRDYDEMNRIRKFLYSTGLYGSLSELDETLKKWRTAE